MARKAILVRDEPPQVHAIVDEAAFLRMQAVSDVAIGQMRALLALPPCVTIQVLPFARGFHAGIDGPFTMLSFPNPEDQECVVFENLSGERISYEAEQLERCNAVFTQMGEMALTPSETTEWISRQLKESNG